MEDNPETDSNESLISEWTQNNDNSGLVRFIQATAVKNAYLMVGNEPGAALPATGGPGTMLMYGLGAVAAEITGYNILSKRRKKYLDGQRHKVMKKRWS